MGDDLGSGCDVHGYGTLLCGSGCGVHYGGVLAQGALGIGTVGLWPWGAGGLASPAISGTRPVKGI